MYRMLSLRPEQDLVCPDLKTSYFSQLKTFEMRFFELGIRFIAICFLVLGLFEVGYSQGCNGLGGGISGGPISINLGVLCANVDALGGPGSGAEINIIAGNVFPGDVVSFAVFWDDGSAAPVQLATQTGPNTWALNNVTHYFPTTGPDVKCEYVPRVTLIINGTTCTANFGSSPKFTRWNVDNENTGILRLTETATDVNTYLVCRGTETTVTFTDRSTLNCVPPDYTLPNPINTLQRWRRFTYGTANTITSATGVEVNNAIQPYPFVGGLETANPSQDPLPPTVTLPITIPDDAQVGEEFEITMEYWNTCNPFPGTPVRETARIRVVDQPPTPTPNNNTVCNATTPLPNFSINIPGGFPATSIVTWFQDNANSPGAIIPGFTTSTLPASAIGVNGTVAGTYRVWASYFGVNNPQGLSCESPRIPVTLIVRENLPIIPAPFTGYSNQICRDDPMTITLPNPPTETAGGATEYVWSVTGGGGVTFTTTSNSATLNFTGVAFGGASSVNRNIRIVRRYTSNPQCTSPNRNLPVQIFAPSVGGSLSAVPDICETSPVGTINLTGERGIVQRWEVSFNNGPFIPNAALGTTTSISPGTVAPGNYRYQAIVANGTCAEAASTIEGLDVFPNPAAASVGVDQQFCKVTLDSNPLGGNTPSVGSGAWSVFSRPATSTATSANFIDPTQGNTIFNGDVFGVYILRWTITSGICVDSKDIEIDFGTLPGPQDAGTAGPFCALSGALNATAPPTVGTGQWSLAPAPIVQPGTAIFTDDLDRNTVVTVSNYGTYTFRWTVTSGICATSSDDVVVRFTQAATATVPSDFTICVDQTLLAAIDLTGSNLVGGGATQGRWERISGLGTIQSSGGTLGSPVSNATSFLDRYVPIVGETSVTLRMVAQHPDLAACPNVNSADLTITIDRRPGVAVAGTNFSVCDGTPATLAATPATNGGSGQWSYVSGPDNTPVFDDDTDATSDVQVSLSGLYEYRWTVNSALSLLPPPTVGATCSPTSAVVQVNVRALPVNNLITPEVCQTELLLPEAHVITLSDFDNDVINPAAIADRQVKWYANENDRDFDISPILTPVDLTPSDNIRYTRVIDTTIPTQLCENLGLVVFTINPKPLAFDQLIPLCEEFPIGSGIVNNVDLTDYEDGTTDLATADRTITWHILETDAEDGINPIADPTDIDLTADAFYFARVVNNDGCFRVARLDLHINARPGDQTILGSETPCTGTQVLYRVNHVSGAKYAWTVPPQFSVLGGGGVGDFYVLLEFNNTTPGDLKVTVSLNGCVGNEILKNVEPSDAPTGYSIDGPTEVCEGQTIEYKVLPDNTGTSTYNWQVYDKATGLIGGGIVASGQTTGTVLINFLNKNVFIRVTESNSANCQDNNPPTHDVDINLNPVIDAATSEVCSDTPINIVITKSADPSNLLPAVDKIILVADPSVYPGLVSKVKAIAGEYLPHELQNDTYENLTIGNSLPVVYRIRPKSDKNCVGDEKNITIDIKAEPAIDPTPLPSVCSDSPVGSLLKSPLNFLQADKFIIENVIYDPLVIQDPGNTILLNQQLNNDAVSAHVWKNLTTVPQIVKYRIRPYSLITDCYGDPSVDIQVTILPKPDLIIGTNNPICSRDQLNISLTSNMPGAQFDWTVFAADPNITGFTGGTTNNIIDQLVNSTLTPGSVTYRVQAGNPAFTPVCLSDFRDVVVQVKPSPNVTTPLNKVTCSDSFGGNTSEQDLTLLHSQISTEAGVTYTWFTDENDSTGSKIPLGQIAAYTLTDEVPVYVRVRNPAASSGCAKVSIVTFDIRPTPQLVVDPLETADNRFNITCNGLSNGQVAIAAHFGTNHTFSLDGAAFVSTILFSGLNAGSHNIRTRNSENCFDEMVIVLEQPDPIVVSTPSIVDVSCFNDPVPDGQITITATGGTSMSGGDLMLFSLLQDPNILYDAGTQTFSGLRAAAYTVRVEDKNGCTKFVPNITVGQPNDLALAIDITSDYNGFDVSCNGKSDGEISVLTTTGGTPLPDYFYTLLDDSMNPTGNTTGELNGVFTGLSANILYSVKVRDGNGCEKISIPEFLFDPVELNPGAIGFDKDICEGGDPTAFQELAAPFGGINLYTFEWLESADNVTFAPAAGLRTSSTYDPPILTSQMFYKRSVTSGTCLPEETDAFKVVVHTKPTATLDAPDEVCEGQTFTLDFTFSDGQAPYFFDYTDGINTYSLIGAEVRPVPISNYTTTKTFTLTHLRDFYGCEPDNYPIPVTPQMINMNNVFTVDPTLAQCSGGNFTFSYTRYPDVEYVWSFNDGSVDRIIPAFSGIVSVADTVQHIFRSVNVSGDTKYPVTLKARSTIPSANCESQSLPQNVIVSPNIFINAVNDKNEICSGETVTVINATLGGTSHRWFYRTQGGDPNEELDLRSFTTPTSQSFILTNNSPALVTYDIVYQVSNGSCSDEVILPVIVHRAITADLDTLSVTKFTGGNAFANFINTSVPQDDVDFRYEWQFGAGAVPSNFNGITPPQIRYPSIGEKTITLTATNEVAEARGLTCSADASMNIFILLPEINAAFSYSPQAICFPSDISITENRGTGDLYEWKLRKVNDVRPLLVSNDSLPTFRITAPGVYVIEFKTTNSITGQFREVDNSATPIEIFDVPFAAFEARPKTIFVPDEQLIITNRSTDANQYDWDFDDGETSIDAEPNHFYALAGKYTITLVAGFNHGPRDLDGDGVTDGDLICYDTAQQEINAKEGGLTRIPNAFTPSTSGPNGGVSSGGTFNDVFIPITKGVEEFEMTIFDRWGNLIFQSTNKNIGWDGYDRNGVLMPAGVYVYKLTMRLSNNQRTTQVGDVTLIR